MRSTVEDSFHWGMRRALYTLTDLFKHLHRHSAAAEVHAPACIMQPVAESDRGGAAHARLINVQPPACFRCSVRVACGQRS